MVLSWGQQDGVGQGADVSRDENPFTCLGPVFSPT